MTSAEEGRPPSNDPEEWQDTHTANCIMQIACFKLNVANCMLQIACCNMHVENCLLQIAFCKLHIAKSMLQIACCKWHVANCMLLIDMEKVKILPRPCFANKEIFLLKIILLKKKICCMQIATCHLQHAICNIQLATCNLQHAICKMQCCIINVSVVNYSSGSFEGCFTS